MDEGGEGMCRVQPPSGPGRRAGSENEAEELGRDEEGRGRAAAREDEGGDMELGELRIDRELFLGGAGRGRLG